MILRFLSILSSLWCILILALDEIFSRFGLIFFWPYLGVILIYIYVRLILSLRLVLLILFRDLGFIAISVILEVKLFILHIFFLSVILNLTI